MLFLMPSLWFVLRPLVPSPTIEKSLALLSAYIWLADVLVMIPNSTNFPGPRAGPGRSTWVLVVTSTDRQMVTIRQTDAALGRTTTNRWVPVV